MLAQPGSRLFSPPSLAVPGELLSLDPSLFDFYLPVCLLQLASSLLPSGDWLSFLEVTDFQRVRGLANVSEVVLYPRSLDIRRILDGELYSSN